MKTRITTGKRDPTGGVAIGRVGDEHPLRHERGAPAIIGEKGENETQPSIITLLLYHWMTTTTMLARRVTTPIPDDVDVHVHGRARDRRSGPTHSNPSSGPV